LELSIPSQERLLESVPQFVSSLSQPHVVQVLLELQFLRSFFNSLVLMIAILILLVIPELLRISSRPPIRLFVRLTNILLQISGLSPCLSTHNSLFMPNGLRRMLLTARDK